MNSEFEGKLLFFRLVLPVLFGGFVSWVLRGKVDGAYGRRGGQVGVGPSVLGRIVGVLAIGFAFIVSDFASRGILFTPEEWLNWQAKEPWMHWVWAGPLTLGLWHLAEASWPRLVGRGVGRFLLLFLPLLVFVLVMFPGGQGYADQAMAHLLLGVLAWFFSVLNWLLVAQRQSVSEGRWFGWVYVLQLGSVAMVVLQSYASLGEWLIFSSAMMAGALAMTAVTSSRVLRKIGSEVGSQVGDGGHESPVREFGFLGGSLLELLLGFASCAGLCVSRAYAWNPLAWWVILVLLGLPSLYSIIDRVLCNFSLGWRARYVGLFVATLMLLVLLYSLSLEGEPQW